MRHNQLARAAFALCLGSTSLASANTLIVEPTSPQVATPAFDYRFDAVHRWLGCFQYDVLQGSGWYPSVWYHTGEMSKVDGAYQTSFRRTWQERYCGATMGLYNYVQVVWTDPADSSRVYRGVLQVDARGTSSYDEVACTLVDPTSPYNAIECESALVSFAGAETTIVVDVNGLD